MLILFFAFVLMAPDGTWQRSLDAQPPFISTVVERIPSRQVSLNHQRPVFALRCAFGRGLLAQLYTAALNRVEPVTSDMSLTRVRFAFDDGAWESDVWRRENFNVVTASADFIDRLEGAREVKIEVHVICRDCGAPLHVPLPIVYRLDARGFTDARDALTQACLGS
jgi:hypothetical protein